MGHVGLVAHGQDAGLGKNVSGPPAAQAGQTPPAAVPALRFGRTEEQLHLLYSVCAGPNLDYSISEEEAKDLKVAAQHRLDFIKSEPDLAVVLVDYIDRAISGEGAISESLVGILRALALRPDVNVNDVKRYARFAAGLLDKKDGSSPMSTEEANLSAYFTSSLPDLLGSYPTQEGEDYLVKILEHPIDRSIAEVDKLASARAAAKSGTTRCLLGLEQSLKDFKRMNERQMKFGISESNHYVQEVEGYLKVFRERNFKREKAAGQTQIRMNYVWLIGPGSLVLALLYFKAHKKS